jgi:hypothetical protein
MLRAARGGRPRDRRAVEHLVTLADELTHAIARFRFAAED